VASIAQLAAKNLATKDVGLLGAVGGAIGERFKSRATKIRESFRPENIIKSLTGSDLLATAVAKKLGRDPTQLRKIAGIKPEATKGIIRSEPILLKIADNTQKTNDLLIKLVKFYEKQTTKDDINKNFEEEKATEEELRWKSLIEAIRGTKLQKVGPASNVDKSGGGSILDSLLSGLAGFGSFLGGGAKNLGSTLKKVLPKLLLNLGKGIITKIPLIGPIIAGAFGLWDAVKEYQQSGDLESSLGSFFEGFLDSMTFGLSSFLLGEGTIKNFTKNIITKTKDFFEDIVDTIKDAFEDYILDPIMTLPTKIMNNLKKLGAYILDWIADTFNFKMKLPEYDIPYLGKVGGQELDFNPFSGLKEKAQELRESMENIEDTAGKRRQERETRDTEKTERRADRDKISEAPSTVTPAPTAPTTPTTPTASATSTAEPLSFTQRKEGFADQAYPDARGQSIGYGHHLTSEEQKTGKIILPDGREIDWKKGISREDANALYQADMKKHSSEMAKNLERMGVDVSKLSSGTVSALEDLAYNAGPVIFNKAPKLVAALKTGDTDRIAEELRTTGTTSQGVKLAGLQTRANERAAMITEPSQAGMMLASATAANVNAGRQLTSGGSTVVNAPTVNNIQQTQNIVPTPGMRNDDSTYNRLQTLAGVA
jgi:GH24 family phage-related lysozyme (muramidase)